MNAISKPSGAYNVIDHTYDVVVVGAGGAGLRATLGDGGGGAADGVFDEGVSDAEPYGCGAGRDWRGAGEHGGG